VLCKTQNYKIMDRQRHRLETSLSDLKNLENLKAAFNFWVDGTYQEKISLTIKLISGADKKTPIPVLGLKAFSDFIGSYKFQPEEIYILGAQQENGKAIFNESFLNYLQRISFKIDLQAIEEGQSVHVGETVATIIGSKIQLKIIENALIDILTEQTLANFQSVEKQQFGFELKNI
jgi:nicotinic acid phosphoribosyltransferase